MPYKTSKNGKLLTCLVRQDDVSCPNIIYSSKNPLSHQNQVDFLNFNLKKTEKIIIEKYKKEIFESN